MQTFYISNSLLGDELAIAQQLMSDILTCFGADVLDKAPLVADAPNSGVSCRSYGGGGKRRPIGEKFGALLNKFAPPYQAP